jgi:hypothetical protein
MNNYKKSVNEKFLMFVIKNIKFWVWTDLQELYIIENGKIKPETKRGFKELSKIVTRSFIENYVIPVK